MTWSDALAHWPGASLLRASPVAYIFANAAHIASLALLVGSIVTLDLCILGLFRDRPFADLAKPLVRVAAFGAGAAILTGLLLFSVRPETYVQNPAFLAKVALVSLGLANALALHRSRAWRLAAEGGATAVSVKIAAALSILIWMSAIVAGRWIGFL
jgi:hypothetical protein